MMTRKTKLKKLTHLRYHLSRLNNSSFNYLSSLIRKTISFEVDKYFNQVKMEKLEEDIANKQNESLAAFDKMDLAKAYDKLFEILWYSQV